MNAKEKEELDYKFAQHELWVDSIRERGEQLAVYGIDFRECDLSGKIFEDVYLNDCIFDGLHLKHVDFQSSYLCLSTYNNTMIRDCNFYWAELAFGYFMGADIRRVSFAKTDCTETNFTNAWIRNSRFTDADLTDADFTGVRFEHVNFNRAIFDKTVMRGVTMKYMKGIPRAKYKSINIGTVEEPIILEGEKAKEWIEQLC